MAKAKKLTTAEREWLNKLEAVMRECPSARLHCYTVGDNYLMFYDKVHADAWEAAQPHRVELDAGDLHDKAGSHLATVIGNFIIDSCAG